MRKKNSEPLLYSRVHGYDSTLTAVEKGSFPMTKLFLEMTGLDCCFPSYMLKTVGCYLQKGLTVSAQYCSRDGLQTATARTEHGKFFAVCTATKNTVKVKKITRYGQIKQEGESGYRDGMQLPKLEFAQDTLA